MPTGVWRSSGRRTSRVTRAALSFADRVLPEQDNVRSALAWARRRGRDASWGSRSFSASSSSGTSTARFELASWLDVFAPEAEALPLELRARVLRVRGAAAEMSGDWAAGEALYRESLRLLPDARRPARHGRAADTERGERAPPRRSDPGAGARRGGRPDRAADPRSHARGAGRRDPRDTSSTTKADMIKPSRSSRRARRLAAEVGFVWWQGVMLGDLAEYLHENGKEDGGEGQVRGGARAAPSRRRPAEHAVGSRSQAREARPKPAGSSRPAASGGRSRQRRARGLLGWWRLERRVVRGMSLSGYADDLAFARGLAEGRGLTLDEAVARALSEP